MSTTAQCLVSNDQQVNAWELLTNESTVSDTESSSDLRGEINVTGRVDQVDQEVGTIGLLTLDVLGILAFGESGVQGDGSRLDRDTT